MLAHDLCVPEGKPLQRLELSVPVPCLLHGYKKSSNTSCNDCLGSIHAHGGFQLMW